jgi:AcrR family transcriptional regulator
MPADRQNGPSAVGLRERKKDASRRAMAEAALSLLAERGYDDVTVADIAERAGVSRRTFSNYFAGKAECVLAVTEGWLDDVLDAVRTAPPDRPLDDVLCAALDRVATDLSQRWERLFVIMQGAPELEAMAGAMDAAIAARLCSAIAGRLGMPADDVRIRMFAAYALLAGRQCVADWVAAGRPSGIASFHRQLELALSIIDLSALTTAIPLVTGDGVERPVDQQRADQHRTRPIEPSEN